MDIANWVRVGGILAFLLFLLVYVPWLFAIFVVGLTLFWFLYKRNQTVEGE